MDGTTHIDDRFEQGHQLRDAGDTDGAYAAFLDVWEDANRRKDHYRATMSAHMLGVIETGWEEKLRWHIEALEHADRSGDERVREFYPSLYVNLGYVHGNLGQMDQALDYYERARAHEPVLSDDEYGSLVRHAIARGLDEVRRGLAPTRDW